MIREGGYYPPPYCIKEGFETMKEGGFTLIEIMIVIVVVLVLAGSSMMMIPGFSKQSADISYSYQIKGILDKYKEYALNNITQVSISLGSNSVTVTAVGMNPYSLVLDSGFSIETTPTTSTILISSDGTVNTNTDIDIKIYEYPYSSDLIVSKYNTYIK
jgi:prepilin-type N-terminal cleavage/methylation domain-containing protein